MFWSTPYYLTSFQNTIDIEKGKYAHLYRVASSRAPIHCLNAQHIIISGAINVQIINSSLMIATCNHDFPGAGMFGWTLTQAHANIVARHDQMMLHIECIFGQLHALAGIGGLPTLSRRFGAASVACWREYTRASKNSMGRYDGGTYSGSWRYI